MRRNATIQVLCFCLMSTSL